MKAFHLPLKHRMKYGSWLERSSKALRSGSLLHLIWRTPRCQESHRPFGNLMAWRGCFKTAATPIWYLFGWKKRSFTLLTVECQPGLKLISADVEEGRKWKKRFFPRNSPAFLPFPYVHRRLSVLAPENIKNKKFFKCREFFCVFKCRPTGMQRL